jgi:hypothetical protein
MSHNGKFAVVAGVLTALGMLAPAPAAAVVYCTGRGVPVGCVVRPAAPAARAVATPGVGAPGVGVRPGTPANRGGPVNRAGRR